MTKRYPFFMKVLLSLMSVLMVCAFPLVGQIEYALQESFESGKIPTEWTQEYVSGSTDWIIEEGGSYPEGAADGSYRVVLRNETQQTQGFKTKLISPVMNLTSVYQPILVFSHAQEHYLTDVDELRVYYRISQEAPWVLMEEYTKRVRDWKTDTIRLIDPGATYQIAFEGTDQYGRGIVLDDIQIRPIPMCNEPVIQNVTDATSNSFTLIWAGSFDTDSFAVKVSTTELTDVEFATGLAVDTIVKDFMCVLQNMNVNTTFYCYVKSYCPGEESAWSDVFVHKTQSYVTLPHKETFDREYNPGINEILDTWTWKNSWHENTSEEMYPYINSKTPVKELSRYSYNYTTCVAFYGSSAISAGQWAYIASPEIRGVDDMNTVQVSFWGTCYNLFNNSSNQYATSLIVGIMDDPENIDSFWPIDTVKIDKVNKFKEFIIPFNNYTGSGKHIAFLSHFSLRNAFFIDDVSIDLIPSCPTIPDVKIKNARPTSTDLVWKEQPKISTYNVVVTTKPVSDPSNTNADITAYKNQISTNVCNIPENTLTPWTDYFVYVQTVNQDCTGEWSKEVSFRTPCNAELPVYYTFEPEIDGFYINSNSGNNNNMTSNCIYTSSRRATVPYNFDVKNTYSNPAYTFDGNYVLLVGETYTFMEEYAAFPYISDVSNTRMIFHAMDGTLTTNKEAVMKVGVMTDMHDFTTFHTIETFVLEKEYKRYLIDFTEYTGGGNYIAITIDRAVTSNSTLSSAIYIDNLTIEAFEGCTYPGRLTAVPGDTTALITWNTTGNGNRYRVKVSPVSIKDILDTENTSVVDITVDENKLEIKGGLIPGKVYYYYVQSLCGSEEAEWSNEQYFATECAEVNSLPYTQDFEDYITEGKGKVGEIPFCWNTEFRKSSSVFYPHVKNDGYGSSERALYLVATTSIGDYVALPEMIAPVKELQISFLLKQGAAGQELEIGVLSDLSDTTTFTLVQTITGTADATNWQEFVVTFDNEKYTGDGKYIMLRVPAGKSQNATIDNVEVDYVRDCSKPQSLDARDETGYTTVLFWNGLGQSQWEVMVLNTNDVIPDDATDENIVFNTVVTQDTCLVDENLRPNTLYYYYLRTICDDYTSSWTTHYGTFRTDCEPMTVDMMGIETFETGETDFDCWILGLQEGSTQVPKLTTQSGSTRLHMYTNTSSNGAYAIMPEIDIDSIKNLQMTFNMYGTTTHDKILLVGVMTDPYADETNITIDTISVELTSDYNRYFTVRFDKYTGDNAGEQGKRIRLLASNRAGVGNQYYIDNIYFDTISACPEPLDFWTDTLAHDYAVLAWEGDEETDYRVLLLDDINPVYLMNDEVYSTVEHVFIDTVVTGPQAGLRLAENTKYYVYIKPECDGEKTRWSNERTFTSPCSPRFPLPFTEDFESYANNEAVSCWYSYHGTNPVPNGIENVTNYAKVFTNTSSYKPNHTKGGQNTLRLWATGTEDNYSLVVTPGLDIEDISEVQVSFYFASGSLTGKVLMGLIDDPLNFDLGNFFIVDTLCLSTDIEGAKSNTPYKYTYDLSYLAGHDSAHIFKRILFVQLRSLMSGAYSYIDDIDVEIIPTCIGPDVDSMSYELPTATSFNLMWVDTIANAWKVQYGEAGFNLGEGQILHADTTAIPIEGLEPETEYHVYIQNICDDGGESRWMGPLKVNTLCYRSPGDAVFGFEEEEGYYIYSIGSTNKVPLCWVPGAANPATVSNIPYSAPNLTGALYARTGTYALRYSVSSTNAYAYIAMSEINGDLNDLQVNFSARAVTHSISTGAIPTNSTTTFSPHVIVGTVAHPEDFSTFDEIGKLDLSRWVTAVDTAKEENNYLWDEIIVPLYGAKNKYVTFMVSYAEGSPMSSGTYYTFIDDVSVTYETGCPLVSRPRASYNQEVTEAELSWKVLGTLSTAWDVRILTEKAPIDSLEYIDNADFEYLGQVDEPKVSELDIRQNTTYYAYIKSVCSDDESNWKMFEFTTPCIEVEAPIEWTFSEGGGTVVYTSSISGDYFAPECWTVGLKTGSSLSNMPYKSEDNDDYIYSRSTGGGHSLRFSTSATNDGAYAITPEIKGDFDTLQIHFHGRAGYAKATETLGLGYQMHSASSGRSITVGTVTDPNDISTFHLIETITFNERSTSEYANEDNNWLFDRKIISLKGAPGKHVAFLAEFGQSNTVYLDDISIERKIGCFAPANAKINSTTSTTADLTWELIGEMGKSWIVRVANDAEMTDFSDYPITTFGSYTITDLKPGTRYYVAVKQICDGEDGDEESEWSQAVEFYTAYTVVFHEDFSIATHIPRNWGRYNNPFFDKDTVYTRELKAHEISGSTISGWQRTVRNYGLQGPHQKAQVRYSNNYWFITPTIHIPNTTTWLSFDLAMTAIDSPAWSEGGDDDRFLVIISDDEGYSWNISNKTEWNNDGTGDYVYNDIPTTGEKVYINLDSYKDKVIKVAFYVESTVSNGLTEIHLDNIHINEIIEINMTDKLCEGHDYMKNGFDIMYEELRVGENNFVRSNMSYTEAEPDSVINLKLTVTGLVKDSISDIICEDHNFEKYGFETINKGGIYKQKLNCESTGCDSIFILNLSEIASIRIDSTETICQGQSFEFNGNFYNRAGIYRDTLSSSTGCDSILIFQLRVNQILREEIYETVCFDSTYNFNGLILSESGVYLDTVQNANGCDCEVALNLTVREELITVFEEKICPGETFTGHGFNNVPSITNTYTRKIETADEKCDSTVILRLTVLDTDTIREEETIYQSRLPYTYHGKRYEEGTPVGTYRDTTTVSSSSGNCESVLIATLHIEEDPGTGIWPASANELSIIPTLIEKGQSVQIIYDLSASSGLKLEVYDMTGKRLYTQYPTMEPIEIGTFSNSGIYLIRAITAEGDIKHGRIVVK